MHAKDCYIVLWETTNYTESSRAGHGHPRNIILEDTWLQTKGYGIWPIKLGIIKSA